MCENNSDFKFNIASGEDGSVTIKHAKALDEQPPKTLNIIGELSAPGDWYEKRKMDVEGVKSFAGVDRNGGTITLIIDENNPYRTSVVGRLTLNTSLSIFKINEQKYYGVKELASLLRMNRAAFYDKEENAKIIEGLSKFSAKINTQLESKDDLKGNIKQSIERTLQTELKLNFILNIPIFSGYEKVKFMVEINADVRDSAVSFWLESIELSEIISNMKEEKLSQQIKRLGNKIPIIYS